jgi:cytochrome P450
VSGRHDKAMTGEHEPRPALEQIVLPDGRPVWTVNRYDEARRLLNSRRLTKEAGRMGGKAPLAALPRQVQAAIASDMLNADPPEHTRLRRMVAGPFGPRQVTRMRPLVERLVGELLDALPLESEVDLLEHYAGPLPTRVLAELFGIPAEDCPRIRRWSDTFVAELLTTSDLLLETTELLHGYVTELIARKRAEPAEDLVSRLVAQNDATERPNEQELGSTVFVLLIAGQTAMAQMIAKGMHLLLTHPAQRARLRTDPALLPTAVEEFLRYDPPLRISAFRMSTGGLDVAGTALPAGEIVLCSLLSANHDEARFPSADRLDVGRGDNHHLAFGHGIHHCLGAPLARLQAEVAIGSFLRRFENARLAVPADQIPWIEAGIMRKLSALPVILG